MSFTYSAIGDNTPENREHLEKLGYEEWNNFKDPRFPILETFYLNGKFMFCGNSGNNIFALKYYGAIDCRNNTSLFQAVTAMREDSDYMQWFISNEKIPGRYVPIPGFNGNPTIDIYQWWYDEWILSTHDKVTSHRYHKASLSELQEYFKKK